MVTRLREEEAKQNGTKQTFMKKNNKRRKKGTKLGKWGEFACGNDFDL